LRINLSLLMREAVTYVSLIDELSPHVGVLLPAKRKAFGHSLSPVDVALPHPLPQSPHSRSVHRRRKSQSFFDAMAIYFRKLNSGRA